MLYTSVFSVIQCPAPPLVINAIRLNYINGTQHIYGDSIRYVCDSGMRTETGHQDRTLTCGGTGQWLEYPFTCQGVYCSQ